MKQISFSFVMIVDDQVFSLRYVFNDIYFTLIAGSSRYNGGNGGLHRGIGEVVCPYHSGSTDHESTGTSQDPAGKLELSCHKCRSVEILI